MSWGAGGEGRYVIPDQFLDPYQLRDGYFIVVVQFHDDSQMGASPDYEWNHSGWFLHVDGGGAST